MTGLFAAAQSAVSFDTPANIAFAVIAVVMVIAAVRVVTTRNVVHAALWLMIVLGGNGLLYLLLQAEFVAMTQFLVYLGAIVVLFLFGIMLTRAPLGRSDDLDNDQRWMGVAVSLIHVLGMVGLRTLAYASQGQPYEFGDWPRELFYEYVKDARTYVGMVVLISFYRLLLRRLQGEASLLAEPDEGQPVEPLDRPERFLVRKLGRDFLVAAADIEWLQASGNYVNLRVRGHDYPLRSTIAGIESRLDPRLFTRVHRSYIVNLGQVASIEPLDAGEARLHLLDGTILPCSRRYRQALRERIDGAAASA